MTWRAHRRDREAATTRTHRPARVDLAAGASGARTRGAAAVIAVVVVAGRAAGAAGEPLPRVPHIAQALAALDGLGPAGRDRLERALYAAGRADCRAETETPAASCLIAAARAACASESDRARCHAAADVIITNQRAARWYVDERTRIQLVRRGGDYRTALSAELTRRFAVLAAELALAGAGPRDLAPAIDRLCVARDREIRACAAGDTACVPSLPWSRCVAALVWFVASSP